MMDLKNKYKLRPFIYRDREDIDSFLEESQLWRDVYEIFLQVKNNAYYLKVPSVRMFNEVRYQCVRLMLDSHPEENVWDNYLNDAKNSLGWRYASDLCFCMVYAVLSLLKNPPKQIARFCDILCHNILKYEQCYFQEFRKLVNDMQTDGISYEIDLSIMPERPSVIRDACVEGSISSYGAKTNIWNLSYDMDWWKTHTDNFDQDTIREIIQLWPSTDEKIEMIDIVEQEYKQVEKYSERYQEELPF